MSFILVAHAASKSVLSPAGPVASAQRSLILTSVGLMLLVVIPFLATFFIIAHKYRAGNKKAKYEPDKKYSPWRQLILWLIPASLIAVLGVISWHATFALDPSQPINSSVPPLNIEVVALPWKWLFIYPSQGIATVNFIQFPAGTPVHFELTADAPMSSFWIPQLGSQIYAMDGMTTQLNLMADKNGDYTGKDTEINGEGYSGMTFTARASSQADFDAWVASVQQSSSSLTTDTYSALAAPSENNPQAFYSYVDPALYNTIVMSFMEPTSTVQMQMDMEAAQASSSASETPNSSATMQNMPMMPGMQM